MTEMEQAGGARREARHISRQHIRHDFCTNPFRNCPLPERWLAPRLERKMKYSGRFILCLIIFLSISLWPGYPSRNRRGLARPDDAPGRWGGFVRGGFRASRGRFVGAAHPLVILAGGTIPIGRRGPGRWRSHPQTKSYRQAAAREMNRKDHAVRECLTPADAPRIVSH